MYPIRNENEAIFICNGETKNFNFFFKSIKFVPRTVKRLFSYLFTKSRKTYVNKNRKERRINKQERNMLMKQNRTRETYIYKTMIRHMKQTQERCILIKNRRLSFIPLAK